MGYAGTISIERSAEELLQEFERTGRPEPFEEIVRRYAGMVFHVCHRVTKDRHDAEDATQAVFAALAVGRKKEGGEVRTIGPWLRQVAKRVSLDIRRGKQRRQNREAVCARENGWNDESSPEPPASGLHAEELNRVVKEELDRLPGKYRLPLVLHYFGGMSQDEMARELGCRPGTLRVRLHRGRQMLAGRLAKRGVVAGTVLLAVAATRTVQSAVTESLAVSFGTRTAAGTAGGVLQAIAPVGVAVHGTVLTKVKVTCAVLLVAACVVRAGAEVYEYIRPMQLQLPVPLNLDQLIRPLTETVVPSLRVDAQERKSTEDMGRDPLPGLEPLALGVVPGGFRLSVPGSIRADLPALPAESGQRREAAPTAAGYAQRPPAVTVRPRSVETGFGVGRVGPVYPERVQLAMGNAGAAGAEGGLSQLRRGRAMRSPSPVAAPDYGGMPGTVAKPKLPATPTPDQPTGTTGPTQPKTMPEPPTVLALRPTPPLSAGARIGPTVIDNGSVLMRQRDSFPRHVDQLHVSSATQQQPETTLHRTDTSLVGHGVLAGVSLLDNSGRVVASGGPTGDAVLDLSQVEGVANAVDNPSGGGNGWYALGRAKLVLPSIRVQPGTGSYSWGESTDDAVPDLVNSVRLTLHEVPSAGQVTLSLLGPERTDVPPLTVGHPIIGLWEVDRDGTAPVEGVELLVRYDAELAGWGAGGEVGLQLFAYDRVWHAVTDRFALDTDADLIAGHVDFATYFAVVAPSAEPAWVAAPLLSEQWTGVVPEPASTVVILAVGGMLLCRRRCRG